MFTTIFAFVIITAYTTAELPSYIHVCNRKDSNYNQCIVNNINNVKDKVCTGFPEFNIPPNEPLIFDKIVIFDANNVKLYLKDVTIYNVCNFVVNSVYTDLERLHFDINLLYRNIYINNTYDFAIRLLVPIANEGLVFITGDNISMKINMDLKVATNNGKKEIYVSKVNINLNITSFKYKFVESEKELTQLHQVLSNIIDSNTEDIITIFKSIVEKRLSQIVISIFNNISYSNYEKLFPE